METKNRLISPTISKLKDDLNNGNDWALDEFWQLIEKNGTPLIEHIENDGQHKLVTFIILAEEDTKNVVIICALADQYDVISNNICERIKNTNIYYKTFKVLNGTRAIYTISKNNSLLYGGFYENLMTNWQTCSPDPFNPKRFIQRYRREGVHFEIEYSVLEMPDAKPRRWTLPNKNIFPGKVEEIDFYSKILNMDRKIWVYTPQDFNIKVGLYHFLVVFDGKAFLEFTQTPMILDNLQAKNKIPPVIAIYIHNYSGFQRGKDLNCYPPFAEFITKELVPWARKNYQISSNPTHLVAIGSSSGGLTASFIGYKYPETFGKILSQSGYYAWYPGNIWFQRNLHFYGKDFVHWWTEEDEKEEEWLTKQFLRCDKLTLKFFVNVGNLETRAIRWVRNFREMLQKKGYTYYYEEYPGGHEYVAWREHLPEGLIYLIGS